MTTTILEYPVFARVLGPHKMHSTVTILAWLNIARLEDIAQLVEHSTDGHLGNCFAGDEVFDWLRVHGDDVTKERLDTILMDTLEYQSKHGTTEGVRLSIDPVGLKEYLLARWGDESKSIGQGIDAFTAK